MGVVRGSSSARCHDRGHALSFHGRVFFHLANLIEGSQNLFHDPPALINVSQFPATEQHIHEDFVFAFKELARTLHLDFDVMVARLGPNSDFLDMDLVLLLLGKLFLLRILEFAEVDDFADRRPLIGCDLYKMQSRLASGFQSLARGHDAEHSALGVDDPHGGNADLLVYPHTPLDRSDSVLLGDELTGHNSPGQGTRRASALWAGCP